MKRKTGLYTKTRKAIAWGPETKNLTKDKSKIVVVVRVHYRVTIMTRIDKTRIEDKACS